MATQTQTTEEKKPKGSKGSSKSNYYQKHPAILATRKLNKEGDRKRRIREANASPDSSRTYAQNRLRRSLSNHGSHRGDRGGPIVGIRSDAYKKRKERRRKRRMEIADERTKSRLRQDEAKKTVELRKKTLEMESKVNAGDLVNEPYPYRDLR